MEFAVYAGQPSSVSEIAHGNGEERMIFSYSVFKRAGQVSLCTSQNLLACAMPKAVLLWPIGY